MGEITVSSTEYWVDHLGCVRKVPAPGKLRFQKCPGHAALRAFVFQRDGFRCCGCGAEAKEIPADGGARDGIWTTRMYETRLSLRYGPWPVPLVIDHRVSIRNGGTNHPDNLQSLCDCCNSAKASLVDAHRRAA